MIDGASSSALTDEVVPIITTRILLREALALAWGDRVTNLYGYDPVAEESRKEPVWLTSRKDSPGASASGLHLTIRPDWRVQAETASMAEHRPETSETRTVRVTLRPDRVTRGPTDVHTGHLTKTGQTRPARLRAVRMAAADRRMGASSSTRTATTGVTTLHQLASANGSAPTTSKLSAKRSER